jgi:hypothetical protein
VAIVESHLTLTARAVAARINPSAFCFSLCFCIEPLQPLGTLAAARCCWNCWWVLSCCFCAPSAAAAHTPSTPLCYPVPPQVLSLQNNAGGSSTDDVIPAAPSTPQYPSLSRRPHDPAMERVEAEDAAAFEREAVEWDLNTWFPVEHLASVEIPIDHVPVPAPEDGLHVIKDQGGMWTKNMKLNISPHGVQLKEVLTTSVIGACVALPPLAREHTHTHTHTHTPSSLSHDATMAHITLTPHRRACTHTHTHTHTV